ncbi:MAG: hypothetical protein IOMNBAOH_02837 [Rhodocyclaceae bacterium]|nr:hypothetical protein [Rhodocyclaceae bacterium]
MAPAQRESGGGTLSGVALRLLVGLPLLIALAEAFGWHYAELWLPWYRTVLDLVVHDYSVSSLGLSWQKGQYLIAGEFVSERLLLMRGQVLPPGAALSASTLMAHALKHPLILAAAALAWPGLSWRGRGLRLLLSLPCLALLETLDVPLVLASAVRDMVSWTSSPAGDAASQLTDWTAVLDGGGRMALGLAAALVAAGLHGRLERLIHAEGKAKP